MNHRSTTVLLILAALICTTPAFHAAADEVEELVPADAAFFLRIDGLDELRAALADDPLLERITARTPMARKPWAWEKLQEWMDMSGEEIVDRYFGRSVALVRESGKRRGPSVLISRVSEEDAGIAIERLKLEETEEVGSFTLYQTSDGKGRAAFSDRWMVLGSPRHADYLRDVLDDMRAAPSLAEDERFRASLAGLPDDRTATLFAHKPDRDELHAAALTRDGKDLTIHYTGRSPEVRRALSKVADREEFTYGPLPKETLAAVTLNLHDDDPAPGVDRILDRLLAPKTFREDVLPRLAAPVVLFVGEAPADRIEPRPDFNAPVVGMAVRLRDREVAAELDQVMDGAVLLANMATMQWQAEPIDVQIEQHNGTEYRVADLGTALSQRLDEPQYKGLARVAYGLVGDWYIISSHAWFHQRCLDTLADPDAGLERIDGFDRMPIGEADAPVAAVWLRGADLSAHLQPILDHIEEVRPDLMKAAEKRGAWRGRPHFFAQRKHERRHRDDDRRWNDRRNHHRDGRRDGRRGPDPIQPAGLIHQLREAADTLEAYRLITAQALRGEDETVRARVHILRR